MSTRALHTIKASDGGFLVAGAILPHGFWFKTARLAAQFARKQLRCGDGATVEVYGSDGALFKTFVVPGDGSPARQGGMSA